MRVAAEVMTQDVEVADRVTEGPGDFFGQAALNEVGAESLIEAVPRVMGLLKEAAALAYLFWCAERHDATISDKNISCQPCFARGLPDSLWNPETIGIAWVEGRAGRLG